MDHSPQLKALITANKQLVSIANNLLAIHNADTATIAGLRQDKADLTTQLVSANDLAAAEGQQLLDFGTAADETVAQVNALQAAVDGGGAAPPPTTTGTNVTDGTPAVAAPNGNA